MRANVDLVYFDAGGGHRAAALALRDVIQQQQRPWNLRLINLTQLLDPTDRFRRWLGFAPEGVYNFHLRNGLTLAMPAELKLLQAAIRAAHGSLLRRLRPHWENSQPDLVVSLIPNFNRALYESLRHARPGVPYATLMTDLADVPPHFWMEAGQEQTLICGSDKAVAQARSLGYAPEQVVLTSGMLLRPSFYDGQPHNLEDRRALLGLDPMRPTAVVMFGGHGADQMWRIAQALPDLQMVLLCGHNRALVNKLNGLRRPAPHMALGFTEDVAKAMLLGDFFIGKPGPGCLSEAVHLGLPVVTWCDAWTMPQERYNTQWVLEHDLGVVAGSLRELPKAVRLMLPQMQRHARAAARMDNRALFEVPEVFQSLLMRSAARSRRMTFAPTPLAMAA